MFIFALIIKLNMEYKRKYVSELKALSQEFADLPRFSRTKLMTLKAKSKSCVRSAFIDAPQKELELGKVNFLSLFGNSGTYYEQDGILWDNAKVKMSALLASYAQELENIIEDAKQNPIKPTVKNLWVYILNIGFLGFLLTLIGGAFLFGMYFGGNKFDKEKLELYESNYKLNNKVDSLQKELVKKK